ncbi:MAG: hypothetical protein U0271_33145 [Polyangiaceae bacterium]
MSPSKPNRTLTSVLAVLAFGAFGASATSLAGCMSKQKSSETATKDDAAPSSTMMSSAGEATKPNKGWEVSSGDPMHDLDAAEHALEQALSGKSEDGTTELAEGDRCSIVCRALASMRVSATELCKLDEERCPSARERLTRAETRAREACPACASPT